MRARAEEVNSNRINPSKVDTTFFNSMGLASEKIKTKNFYNYLDRMRDEFIAYFEQLMLIKESFDRLNIAVLDVEAQNNAQKLSEDLEELLTILRRFYNKFQSYDENRYQLHFHKLCQYEDFQMEDLEQHLKKDYLSQVENNNSLVQRDSYCVVDSVKSEYFREYCVDFPTVRALSGSFIEVRNEGSSPKIIINTFPKKPEGEQVTNLDLFKAQMKYSLAVASQLIATFSDKPSEKNQIEFSIDADPDRIFLYAAIRLLGKHSSLNFDEKAIRISGDLSGAIRDHLENEYNRFMNATQPIIDEVKKDFDASLTKASEDEVAFFRSIEEVEKVTRILLPNIPENPVRSQKGDQNSMLNKFKSLEEYQEDLDALKDKVNAQLEMDNFINAFSL